MKSMLKIMLVLALAFASTFIVLNATGLLSIERIKYLLNAAQDISPMLIGTAVTILLFADLFVAMPTLTIMLLSGFFLGPVVGAGFSIAGLLLAGFTGYGITHRFGGCFIDYLVRDDDERCNATNTFKQHGVVTILLSRAVPILPEVSACMAGLTHMPLRKFVPAWLASSVPYAIIAAYAGSISSASTPQPAIYTAIGLTVFFWLAWFIFNKRVSTASIRSVPSSDQYT